MSLLATFVAAVIALDVNTTYAAEIKVMAVNAIREQLIELVLAFEKPSNHTATVIWGGTKGIAKKIISGEVTDITIIAAPSIDKLISARTLLSFRSDNVDSMPTPICHSAW